jgi:hypothetical protein
LGLGDRCEPAAEIHRRSGKDGVLADVAERRRGEAAREGVLVPGDDELVGHHIAEDS